MDQIFNWFFYKKFIDTFGILLDTPQVYTFGAYDYLLIYDFVWSLNSDYKNIIQTIVVHEKYWLSFIIWLWIS